MTKRAITKMVITAQILGILIISGCQSGGQTGSLIGALAGAGVGQLAGGSTEATLIGAAVGGGAGYIWGNESDKKKARIRTDNQMYAMNEDINSQIVNVTNSNGSVIQVKLRRQGVGWVGTRGEYYATLPTEDQLRPVYGF